MNLLAQKRAAALSRKLFEMSDGKRAFCFARKQVFLRRIRMSGEPTNIRRAMSGDFPEIERLCVSHGLDANRHLHFAANLDRSLVLTDASGKVVAAITDYPVSVAAALLLVDFEYLATQQGWEEVRCFILENFKAYRERGLGGALLMLETALGKEIGEKIPQELATVPKQGGLLHLAVFTHNGSDVPSLVN